MDNNFYVMNILLLIIFINIGLPTIEFDEDEKTVDQAY